MTVHFHIGMDLHAKQIEKRRMGQHDRNKSEVMKNIARLCNGKFPTKAFLMCIEGIILSGDRFSRNEQRCMGEMIKRLDEDSVRILPLLEMRETQRQIQELFAEFLTKNSTD